MVNDTNKELKVHEAKIWPEFFEPMVKGEKPIEIRINDRDYQQGEVIDFHEWDPKTKVYTERHIHKEIYYTLAFADLSADIKNTLGINPSPSSLNKLIILTMGPLSAQAASKLMLKEMKARPLHIENMGEPDFDAKHILAAHIYEIEEKDPDTDQSAILGVYLINSNTFHPHWTQWVCSLIHLRDIDGVSPAMKHYPQAEFELTVQAVDPEAPITERKVSFKDVKFLTPIDSVVQFNGISDDQARGIQRSMMGLIANAQISPDVDYRATWKQKVSRRVQEIRSAH